nr:uncharacterized protein CI109_007217 [Kwoniella shandongensis]KAA5524467.1 hypothetical protein CI109_007217 [Kwoniella shandongensis]
MSSSLYGKTGNGPTSGEALLEMARTDSVEQREVDSEMTLTSAPEGPKAGMTDVKCYDSQDGPGLVSSRESSQSSSQQTQAIPLPHSSVVGLPDGFLPPNSESEKSNGTPPRPHFLDDKSSLFKLTFIIVCCATQLLTQAQFGMLVFPLHAIAETLGTQDPGEMSWISASYGLTIGMFLVMAGRLGDMYGPKLVWKAGCVVIIVANVGSGFCKSPIPFDICRALTGLGSALALPNALAILGRTFPPGRTRNMVFATLGALAPAGFWVGGIISALFAQFVSIPWIWWFTAIFTFVFLLIGLLVLPRDTPHPDPSSRRFDYLGTLLLSLAMGLFNFSWNQAALVGWSEPYVYAILIVSLLCFPAFFLWEKKVGERALIPVEVLTRQSLLVYLCLWLGWMSLGTLLIYSSFFIYNIRGHHQPLTLVAQMFPLVPAGVIAALIVPWLLHNVPGHIIFLIAMIAFALCNLLAATAPSHSTYWGNTFFSFIIGAVGPDLSFSTGQLIVSNSVDHRFQGIAAGMVSMITNYSMSIGLGMTGTVERYVRGSGNSLEDVLRGYRAGFWFSTGLGALSTVIVALFVRMPKQQHRSKDSNQDEEKGQIAMTEGVGSRAEEV